MKIYNRTPGPIPAAIALACALSACGPRYASPPTTPYAPFQGPDSLVLRVAERPAVVPPGVTPGYPGSLRRQGRGGTVVVAYVTDSAGAIMSRTPAVLHSDDPAFTRAVCSRIMRQRVQPVTVGGRARRALRIQTFDFRPDSGEPLPSPDAEEKWRKTPPAELLAAVVRSPRCGG